MIRQEDIQNKFNSAFGTQNDFLFLKNKRAFLTHVVEEADYATVYQGVTSIYGGGGTSTTFTVTGAETTDVVVASIASSTNAVSLVRASITSANTMTVVFSADPGASTTVSYQILRQGGGYNTFFVAPTDMTVVRALEVHEVAGTDGSAVTLNIEKLKDTETPGNGVDVLLNGFDLKATADTYQTDPPVLSTIDQQELSLQHLLFL